MRRKNASPRNTLFSLDRVGSSLFSALLLPLFILGSWACSDNSTTVADNPNEEMQTPATVLMPLTGDRPTAKTWKLTQNSRKEVVEKFVLDPSEKYTYKFIQSNETPPPIDILLIIDNSGSMSVEHVKLSEKLAFLLKEIKYTDWQINVITTDSPCEFDSSILPLTAKTTGYELVFQDLIKSIPVNGGEETGMAMLLLNIRGESRVGGKCKPKSWLRKDAALVVIELTDEVERVYNGKSITTKEVIDGLAEEKYVMEENLKFFGLFYPPQFTAAQCACADTSLGPNMTLSELISLSKGTFGNICAADYSQALSEISENASVFTRTSFSLGHTPAIGTIKVDHNGVLVGGADDEEGSSSAWYVMDDLFIYNRPLAPEDELTIDFMLIDPRSFHLSQKPLPETIQVSTKKRKFKFDADISYKSSENTIYFYNSLTAGEEVSIKYQTPVELLSEFDFPFAEKGIVQCFANDIEISSRYLKTEGKIIFNSAPEEGATISCQYE